MRRTKSYDAKLIEVTQGNIDNSHIYLRSALALVPEDAIGGTNAASPGKQIAVTFVPGSSVKTDLPADKLFLRCRSEVGEFFRRANVTDGDFVLFIKRGAREFEVRKA